MASSLSRQLSNGTKRSATGNDKDEIEAVHKRAKPDGPVNRLRGIYTLPQSPSRDVSSITSARHSSIHLIDEAEVVLFGAAADVLDEVVRSGAEAEVDVVPLGKYVTVAVA